VGIRGLKVAGTILLVAAIACSTPRDVELEDDPSVAPSSARPDAAAAAANLDVSVNIEPIDAPMIAGDVRPMGAADVRSAVPTGGTDALVVCQGEDFACGGSCLPSNQPSCCEADRTLDSDLDGIADCEESVVPGGQFNRNVGPWIGFNPRGISWSPLDRAGAEASGSLRVISDASGALPGCSSFEGGQRLAVSLDYLIPPGQAVRGHGEIAWVYYRDACLNIIAPDITHTDPTKMSQVGAWTRMTYTLSLPRGAASFRFILFTYDDDGSSSKGGPFVMHFDNVVFRRL
jgi:hypothetical protein